MDFPSPVMAGERSSEPASPLGPKPDLDDVHSNDDEVVMAGLGALFKASDTLRSMDLRSALTGTVSFGEETRVDRGEPEERTSKGGLMVLPALGAIHSGQDMEYSSPPIGETMSGELIPSTSSGTAPAEGGIKSISPDGTDKTDGPLLEEDDTMVELGDDDDDATDAKKKDSDSDEDIPFSFDLGKTLSSASNTLRGLTLRGLGIDADSSIFGDVVTPSSPVPDASNKYKNYDPHSSAYKKRRSMSWSQAPLSSLRKQGSVRTGKNTPGGPIGRGKGGTRSTRDSVRPSGGGKAKAALSKPPSKRPASTRSKSTQLSSGSVRRGSTGATHRTSATKKRTSAAGKSKMTTKSEPVKKGRKESSGAESDSSATTRRGPKSSKSSSKIKGMVVRIRWQRKSPLTIPCAKEETIDLIKERAVDTLKAALKVDLHKDEIMLRLKGAVMKRGNRTLQFYKVKANDTLLVEVDEIKRKRRLTTARKSKARLGTAKQTGALTRGSERVLTTEDGALDSAAV